MTTTSRDHIEAIEAIVSGLLDLPEWARFGMDANRMTAEAILSILRSAGFVVIRAQVDA